MWCVYIYNICIFYIIFIYILYILYLTLICYFYFNTPMAKFTSMLLTVQSSSKKAAKKSIRYRHWQNYVPKKGGKGPPTLWSMEKMERTQWLRQQSYVRKEGGKGPPILWSTRVAFPTKNISCLK